MILLNILIIVLSIIIFIKTLNYGIYEIKSNNNKSGGITVIITSIITLALSVLIIYIKGVN